jgi:hypothetical protein
VVSAFASDIGGREGRAPLDRDEGACPIGAAAFGQCVSGWVAIGLGVRLFVIGRALHRIDAPTDKMFRDLGF